MAEPKRAEAAVFGALLRRHRLDAGLTQAALAEKAGLGIRSVQDLERGIHRPHRDTTQQLILAFEMVGEPRAEFEAAAQPLPRQPTEDSTHPPPLTTRSVAFFSSRTATSGGPLQTNLPSPWTSFVGRTRDEDNVTRSLTGARLVTLTGAGGVGKTRLAIEVARRIGGQFTDGVWLVELAALTDPRLVTGMVAITLGLRGETDLALADRLDRYLSNRRLLLLLDNCEHLIDACARLAHRLLSTCPEVSILATSREPLRLVGETVLRVPSLPVPASELPFKPEELLRCDSARLFVDRASARAGFVLTTKNAAAVARICCHVAGIPLAVELAAARVSALDVEEVANRLDRQFPLLLVGDRAAVPRQQTLRATFDWSYRLLSDDEQRIWRQLAVFAGGFTLEAAEAVCGDVVELLTRLVDKSLVVMDQRESATRYRLLEPLRQYAWEKLVEFGQIAPTRDRHGDWCLALAERSEPELRGDGQRIWLDRLEAELPNFRAALGWSKLQSDRAVPGLRLAAALGRFWFLRSYFTEGRSWLTTTLERTESFDCPSSRARALASAGILAWQQGDNATAHAELAESLVLSRAVGDRWGSAFAQCYLGMVDWRRGDYAGTLAWEEAGLAIFRELGDRWGIATGLRYMARAERDIGHSERAMGLYREALTLYRALGDEFDVAQSLEGLGQVALDLGADDEARRYLEETLASRRSLKDKVGTARCLCQLAGALRRHGDVARAEVLLEESLAIGRETGNKNDRALAMSELGALTTARGDHGRARAALEEALALRRELGEKPGLAAELAKLANLAASEGDLDQASALLQESLAIFRHIGAKRRTAEVLRDLGLVARRQGDHLSAQSYLEASRDCFRELGDECRTALLGQDLDATR